MIKTAEEVYMIEHDRNLIKAAEEVTFVIEFEMNK